MGRYYRAINYIKPCCFVILFVCFSCSMGQLDFDVKAVTKPTFSPNDWDSIVIVAESLAWTSDGFPGLKKVIDDAAKVRF